jgi:hypothetical protein
VCQSQDSSRFWLGLLCDLFLGSLPLAVRRPCWHICIAFVTGALFVWLISHQPAVLFSQNKPAITNQPAVLFSQNKPAPAISHQPNEQAVGLVRFVTLAGLFMSSSLILFYQ